MSCRQSLSVRGQVTVVAAVIDLFDAVELIIERKKHIPRASSGARKPAFSSHPGQITNSLKTEGNQKVFD